MPKRYKFPEKIGDGNGGRAVGTGCPGSCVDQVQEGPSLRFLLT
jgi:hypothetical protein